MSNLNLNKELHKELKRIFKGAYDNFTAKCLEKDRKDIVFIASNYVHHAAMEAYHCPDKAEKTPEFVLQKLFDIGAYTQQVYTYGIDEEPCEFCLLAKTYNHITSISIYDNIPSYFAIPEVRDTAIREILALLKEKNISIGDDGRLIDIFTVYHDVFMFGAICSMDEWRSILREMKNKRPD